MPSCLYPLNLTKITGERYTVACGRCIACRINRTTEWTTRLLHERSVHQHAVFITLTYSDRFLPEQGSLSKRDLQLYFKRLRRELERMGSESSIRYYACGEYGEKKGRPHYHAIVFGLSHNQSKLIKDCWSRPVLDRQGKMIKKNGEIITEYLCDWSRLEDKKVIGTVTEKSARYCASYCQKQLFQKKEDYKRVRKEREFVVMSRKPGLGSVFAQKFIHTWLSNGFIAVGNKRRPIPRYYYSKVSEEEAGLAKDRQALKRFKDISRQLEIAGNEMDRRDITHPKENRRAKEEAYFKKIELYNSKQF